MENSRMSPYLVKNPLRTLTSPINFDSKGNNEDDLSDSEVMNYSEKRKRSLSPEIDDNYSDSSGGSTPTRSDGDNFWNRLSNVTIPEPPEIILCFWCKRVCDAKNSESDTGYVRKSFPLSNGDRHFCSEICFSQCRRASFKKSKICDWCRRVRPTVSYVGFTDGDHQLQFCSDKCLNQYKMQIFCRETEAHLQLHPHLNSLAYTSKQGAALITPELWLKDCTKDIKENMTATNDFTEPFNPSKDKTDTDYRSGISSDSNSPASSVSESEEPVNLTTSHNPRNNKRSKSPEKRSPEPPKTRNSFAANAERENTLETKSYNNQIVKETNQQIQLLEKSSSNDGPKGTIRVRHLEDQFPQRRINDPPTRAVTPRPSTPTMISHLERLMTGGRIGYPELPPVSNHPDLIANHQVLSQLLLTHPEIFRFHGPQPPFMHRPPSNIPMPTHPTPTSFRPNFQPTTPLPIPKPQPQHHPAPPIGFPPVTILLPLPLPIPIPIPIPIPMLIPINRDPKAKSESSSTEASSSKKDCEETAASNQEKVDQESKVSASNQTQFEQLVVDALNLHKTKQPNSLDATLTDSGKKERRSIFKYTSDVYDMNIGTSSFGAQDKQHQPWKTCSPNKDNQESNAEAETSISAVQEHNATLRKRKLDVTQSPSQVVNKKKPSDV